MKLQSCDSSFGVGVRLRAARGVDEVYSRGGASEL